MKKRTLSLAAMIASFLLCLTLTLTKWPLGAGETKVFPRTTIGIIKDKKGENFDPKRLYLLDEVNGNYLFRGNMPTTNGKFCYDKLQAAMSSYLKKQGKALPENYTFLDVSLLNYIKDCRSIEAEKAFCEKNKCCDFWLDSLYGVTVSPFRVPANVRNFILKHHDLDGLKNLMQRIHDKLNMAAKSSLVIYVHCEAGKDRTGEASAAYLMQFRQYSYKKAVALDTKIAKRKPLQHSMNMIRWYAFYLRDIEKTPTIGKVEGK